MNIGNKFNAAKCETTCRLALGRIKLLKNKRQLQIKQHRRDIADLLRQGKQDYARIRVEAVIRENAMLQAFELLELYLELLAVRAPLIAATKEIPRDMIEAVSSCVYAASRVPDMPELATLQKLFAGKYGKEYIMEASSDVAWTKWMVNETLRQCLLVEPPEGSTKLETLSEIAQEFEVEWDLDRAKRELLRNDDTLLYRTAVYTDATMPMHAMPQPGAVLLPSTLATALPTHAPAATNYSDAQSAAAAAASAAAQAKLAADAAAHFARGPGGPGGAAAVSSSAGAGSTRHGDSTGSGTAFMAVSGGDAQVPPPVGWLADTPLGTAQQQASGIQPQGSTTSTMAGSYRVPPPEEVQAAYDAARGPPVKVKPTSTAAASAPASNTTPVQPPSPYAATVAQPVAPDNEYDELQKRFAALKGGL